MRECRVIPVNLRLLPVCFFLHTGLWVHRAPDISPRPLSGGKLTQSFGRVAPRDREGMFERSVAQCPHQLSSPAHAGDPVSRGTCDETERPRRTGCPRMRGV